MSPSEPSGLVRSFEELTTYKQSFELAMRIFELTHSFPKEERFGLSTQIRNSSRSVSANIAEAWGKRRYPNHFVSKLTDAYAEANETAVWVEFAYRCGYITVEQRNGSREAIDAVCGSLVKMMNSSKRWCGPSVLRETIAEYSADTE